MNFNRTALGRISLAVVVMLAATFVLWWAIWAISAAQFRSFIDEWIASHATAGNKITYDTRMTGGFPRHITLHFSNFVLENDSGIRVHSDNIDLSTLPWRWHHLTAKTTHGFGFTIPFGTDKVLDVAAEAAHTQITLAPDGNWQSLELKVTNGKALWAGQPFFSGDNLELSLARPNEEPKDNKEAGLMLSGSAKNLVLPPNLDAPFGQKVLHVRLNVRVMGAVPDPRKKASVAAWNSANNVIDFDELNLDWGSLIFTAHGTLGLDDDLQPEGAFIGQIGNHQDVLKALIDKGEIPKRDEDMLNSALSLFTKPATIEGKPGIEVPISAQLGGLFLGPVHVFGYPEIHWSDNETAPVSDAPAMTPNAPIVPLPADSSPQTTPSPAP